MGGRGPQLTGTGTGTICMRSGLAALLNYLECQQRTQMAVDKIRTDAEKQNQQAAVPIQLIMELVDVMSATGQSCFRIGNIEAAKSNLTHALMFLEPIAAQAPPFQLKLVEVLIALGDVLEAENALDQCRMCTERGLNIAKNLVPVQHPIIQIMFQRLRRIQAKVRLPSSHADAVREP